MGTPLLGHGDAAPAGVLIREQPEYLRTMTRPVWAALRDAALNVELPISRMMESLTRKFHGL